MDMDSIRQQLSDKSDTSYGDFVAKLIPNISRSRILGVRLPQLRKLAQQIVREDCWRTFLAADHGESFELTMLQGMVIGYIHDVEVEEILREVRRFVRKIDNWSVCDSFCSGLKLTKLHQDRVWRFLEYYLGSSEEYEIRFGVVMLLNYYVDARYIGDVLRQLNGIQHDAYYVKMAVAWAISICYIKLPQPTMALLRHNDLDDFTYNKALQKIIESHRIDPETKTLIRSMRR